MDEQNTPNTSDERINLLLSSRLSDTLRTISKKLLNSQAN